MKFQYHDSFYRTTLDSFIICNLNLHHYEIHGFRIGAATAAAGRGWSELQIQNKGDGRQML